MWSCAAVYHCVLSEDIATHTQDTSDSAAAVVSTILETFGKEESILMRDVPYILLWRLIRGLGVPVIIAQALDCIICGTLETHDPFQVHTIQACSKPIMSGEAR